MLSQLFVWLEAPSIESVQGLSIGWQSGPFAGVGAFAEQKIEIAALIGLEHCILKEAGVAANGRLAARRRLLPCGEPSLEILLVDEQVDASSFDVEPDLVAGLDDRE